MKSLRPFVRILDFADKTFVNQFADDVKKALIYRLENLSDMDIKELDKDIIRETVDVLKNYIILIDPDNANKMAELYELHLAHRYLKCPFFEKRVRGINELKEIYYKVYNA